MLNRCCFPLFLFLVLFLPVNALAWKGKVVEIKNPRTFLVQKNGTSRLVYLYGISVPEGNELFAQKAREFVEARILDQVVQVNRLGAGDKIKAMVYTQGEDKSINRKLLENGLAWVHQAYCEKARLCGRLTQIQGQAKQDKMNLWSKVPDNTPAWRWLKEQK